MENDDAVLIHRILEGDDTAFSTLVERYQKHVHAIAWRKIGDFHIAEDITQDTFLRVYQKLSTLKDPNQFLGWLYVVTSRCCLAWLRKNHLQTEVLDDKVNDLIENDAYSRYVAEEKEKVTVNSQREVVKTLLSKLQESERTVMTLHYLGEMTCAEISKMLGVSLSTVKSRLRRGRQRLKKNELIIREALEHFQISPNLTKNILQEVCRIKPSIAAQNKPVVPWIIAASIFVVMTLMYGIGNQYLTRFQEPYNYDAISEKTVAIVDVSTVLNVPSKMDVRKQVGHSDVAGKSNGSMTDSDTISSIDPMENVVLNSEESSKNVLGIFRTPNADSNDYTIVQIDTTAYKDGGTLTIEIWVGSANASGSFSLFDGKAERTKEGVQSSIVATASGIPSGKTGRITHYFDKGTIFQLRAIGNSFINEKGSTNSFFANIFIETEL